MQFMCLMQVVYSKDKGLQSLNQKRCWCNYKRRLVLQRGLQGEAVKGEEHPKYSNLKNPG